MKRYIWVESIAAILFGYMLFNRDVLHASGTMWLLRIFADAFTVPGLILLLSGLLIHWNYALKMKYKWLRHQKAENALKDDCENGGKALQPYCRPMIMIGGIHLMMAVVLNYLFYVCGY
jgi:hypothetical protein